MKTNHYDPASTSLSNRASFPYQFHLRIRRLVVLGCCMGIFIGLNHSVLAEPPTPREVARHVHKRISGFFYKAARFLEGDSSEKDYTQPRERELEPDYDYRYRQRDRATSGTGTGIQKPRRVEENYRVESSPRIQQPQPGLTLKSRRDQTDRRYRVEEGMPVDVIDPRDLRGDRENSSRLQPKVKSSNEPGTAARSRSQERNSSEAGNVRSREGPSAGRDHSLNQSSVSESQAQPSVQETEVKYATPVPGKEGFVYPPGAEKTPENMLDVRGLGSGQKAKDPRTGAVFLVP